MNTRHLVDPEVLPIIELLPVSDMTRASLPEARLTASESMVAMFDPALVPQRRTVPGHDGAPDVAVLVFDPATSDAIRPAVLHIHGGGMVIGSADMARIGMPSLALALGALVVSVDYRLAPDTPFPGPQNDNFAALAWLFDQAAALRVDPARIVVMGESAGGGLAAALAVMARDRGLPPLAGQVLTYPMLDHRTGGDRDPWRNRHTGEFIWTRERNQFGWDALRGDYALDDGRIGWFSPARAADLAGLAPAYIATGALDLFLDEDLDYARRLADAGVPVEMHVYPGAIHAFDMIAGSRVGRQSRRDLVGGVARLLGVTPAT
ncbi:alpha/beta hydrolase [Novosphingobium lentum]|uniref:alpha/beta hydrolase n=1 Tax=Novosphingobium lentum TaxID=145287 RepID=UPI00082F0CFD|nr:alpha/beta hydrolase [Novosphingobium lentum]